MKKLTSAIKRFTAFLLAGTLMIMSVPVTAFAAEEPVIIPEQQIDETCITDGMFYFNAAEAEIGEDDPGIYRLYIKRNGTDLPKADIRVTMLDMTASYGKDYIVSAEDANIFTGGVNNQNESISIKDYMLEHEDSLSEYNYSDAIIDGTITSDNQMSDEEIENLALSDEETAQMQQSLETAADFLLNGSSGNDNQAITETEDEDHTDAITIASPSSSADEEPADAVTIASPSSSDYEESADAVTIASPSLSDYEESADAIGDYMDTTATPSEFSSLARAKEYATGLKDDRQVMALGDEISPMSITDDLSSQSSGYMSNSISSITDALSSAYVILEFDEGDTEKYIDIRTIDNSDGEGDKQSGFNLSGENDEQISGIYSNFTLKILDDEEYEPAVVEFSDDSYYPENGFITVTIERSVNTNSIASVMLDTEDISAMNTRDYSKVHAQVIFGYGITKRIVKIPVVSTYLNKDVSFKLKLQEAVDCVIGERNEAAGIIRTTDLSFDAEAAAKASSSETGQTEDDTSNGRIIGLRDIITADVSEKGVYSSGADCPKCYSRADGTSWVLHAENDLKDVSAGAFFAFSEPHYDYSGLMVDWKREQGWPGYGKTKFQFYEHETGAGWVSLWEGDDRDWERQSNCYFFRHGVKECFEYGFYILRNGGFFGRSPTLTIYDVKPVYRPFMIGLSGSNSVEFIAPDGKIKKNTEISGMESENRTILLNSNDNVLITNTNNNSITVALDNAKYTYISGLVLESWDGTKSVVIMDGLDESTTSVSLPITNKLISNNKDLIEFCQIDGGDRGDYGRFRVRALLKTKSAQLSVKNDDRASVTVEGGNGTIRQGTSKAGSTNYDFHLGDTVIYHVDMKDSGFTWNQINVTNVVPKGETVGRLREHEKDAQGKDIALDTTRAVLTAAQTQAETQYSKKQNSMTVCVRKEDADKFEKTGIFSITPETDGQYFRYVIDKDVSYSEAQTGTSHVAGTRYILSASTIDKNLTPVWEGKYLDGAKFMQNEYYFEGTEDPDTNTVYLSAEKPDNLYSLGGQVYYSDSSLDGSVSSDKWHKAPGVYITTDRTHYGISDSEGKFETMLFPGKEGYCIKYRFYADGDEIWKNVKLNKSSGKAKEDPATGKTVTYYYNDMGSFLVNPISTDRVHFNTVVAKQRISGVSRTISINDDITDLTATLQLVDPLTGKSYEYSYTDADGNTHSASENVTDVIFVVVDPDTKKQKATYKAKKSDTNPAEWTYEDTFQTGYYSQYKSGDRLYVKMITDRITGEDTGKKVCEYAMINTGIVFSEPNPKVPNLININFPVKEFYQLPIIGDLTCFVNALGMSFGISPSGEPGGIRIFFGKQIKSRNNHFDGNGKIASDTGFDYSVTDVANITNVFKDMSDMVSTFGSKNILNAMSLGIPAWSIEPMAGIYFEFGITKNNDDQIQNQWMFKGGGGYIGVMGTFRYTYYMLIYGVPVYVGGDVSLTLLGEFGAAVDEGKQIPFSGGDPDQSFFDDLIKNTHFEFIFQSVLTANAYAGVGICGTLGIRGGFNLTLLFIYNPTIKRSYSDMREVGFAVIGGIRFWADVILLSIPIPIHTWDDWYKMGYFEDLDKKKKKTESDSDVLGSISDAVIVRKPRNESSSVFEGDQPAEKIVSGISEYSQDRQQLYSYSEEQTIVRNGFDNPSQKLMNFTSEGKEKILMVYLDDNMDLNDDERTELKYTVYDIEDNTWTKPLTVQGDCTADFSPSLCDAGNRILITWVSREQKLVGNPEYKNYLESLEIYAADFDKDSLQISDTVQLTDDQNYDTTPFALYSNEGGKEQILVMYYKSEVPEIENAQTLITSASPELNNSELMYMLYEDGEWVRDRYYSGELAEGTDPAPLIRELNGQRFVKSPIVSEGINNPAIGDAVLSDADIIVYDADELEARRKEIYDAGDIDSEKAIQLKEEILNTKKNMGVLAYSVDTDQVLSTEKDREIFVQTYDFDNHEYSEPIRITDNTVNDSLPQIVKCDSTAYLVWLSDGKVLKYVNLSGLLLNSSDGKYNGFQSTAGTNMTSKGIKGVTVNNYRIFSGNPMTSETSDECTDCKCDMYVAWQESSDSKEEDGDFSQDIYVSGLVFDDYNAEESDMSGTSWSDGVRMSRSNKMNELPEFACADNKIMMVGNRFKFNSNENGEAYQASEQELVSTLFEPMPQLELDSVTVETYPEKPGDRFRLKVGVRNTGLKATESFDYGLCMVNGNEASPDSGMLTDRYEKRLPAGSTTFFTVEAELDEEKDSLMFINRSGNEAFISYDLYCVFENSDIGLSDIESRQDGNDFIISGTITNYSFRSLGETDHILIYDANGGKNVDISAPLPDIAINKSGRFEVKVPADAGLCESGYQDMTAVLVDKNGDRLSDYCSIRAYLDTVLNIRVNNAVDGETISIRCGESQKLNVSYSPDSYYRNGTAVCMIEDTDIAVVENGILRGLKKGTTKLHVSIDPYGSESVFNIEVKDAAAGGGTSGHSSSFRPGNGPKSAKHMTGKWKQNEDGDWRFICYDGSSFKGWGYIPASNGYNYYHMNADGILDSGWFFDQSEKKWYYLNENPGSSFGVMIKGWHLDRQDGKWYYLDPEDGSMRTGWIEDKGKWYYLFTGSGNHTWIQDEKGIWIYKGSGRSLGSMYVSEKTPDGYEVDANGAWIKH
ncbi:MAG: Calx-beta domain-containing protein [Lachnospiraceae bacterium]|nr:Calx-beta domain-containing protein [Lachnospiraceae bacterium]